MTDDIRDALDEVGAPTESGGFFLAPAGRVRGLWSQLVIAQNLQRSRYIETRDALNDALEYLRSRGQDETGQEVIKRCQVVLDKARDNG